jgi:dUTP pyrophosphatase
VKTDAAVDTPFYATNGSAGFDLAAAEEVMVYTGRTVKIRTGLSFEIPEGYEGQVRPRSGMTYKTKLRVALGTIDSDYRGEVCVIVDNIGEDVKRIAIGERIAQMIISPVVQVGFDVVESLTDTDRGAGGFGSTGVLKVNKTELEELKKIISEVMG